MNIQEALGILIRQDYQNLAIPESDSDIDYIANQILGHHATEISQTEEFETEIIEQWYADYKKAMITQIFFDLTQCFPDLKGSFGIGIDGLIMDTKTLKVNFRTLRKRCKIRLKGNQPNLWEKIFSERDFSKHITDQIRAQMGTVPERISNLARAFLCHEFENDISKVYSNNNSKQIVVDGKPTGMHKIDLNGLSYIATGYPRMPALFWKTVAQEKPFAIVKLSSTGVDYGKSIKIADDFMVTLIITKTIASGLIQKTFEITKGDSKHCVELYDFKNWPDFSVPKPEELKKLLDCLDRNFSQPLLVHCTGGIGRTGTFIPTHAGLIQWETTHTRPSFNLMVKEERQQRPLPMLETREQYMFLHAFFNGIIFDKVG